MFKEISSFKPQLLLLAKHQVMGARTVDPIHRMKKDPSISCPSLGKILPRILTLPLPLASLSLGKIQSPTTYSFYSVLVELGLLPLIKDRARPTARFTSIFLFKKNDYNHNEIARHGEKDAFQCYESGGRTYFEERSAGVHGTREFHNHCS